MTLKEFKKILGDSAKNLTPLQIRKLKDQANEFARVLVVLWVGEEVKKKGKKKKKKRKGVGG